uniref:Tetraspanin n=1 Tax=Monopterus albus TaxID=43700 RepID=A0A3Q3IUU0_MONAL
EAGTMTGLQCVKYLVFVFNFLFWLAGSGVLAVGLWLRFDSRTSGLMDVQDSPSVFVTGVYILIAAGALMMIVGFLGCCGAIKESPCMLGLFFVCLLLIFAVEVAAGIWGFANRDRVVEEFTEFYKQTFSNYKSTGQEALKEALRIIHFGLNCCGPTGTEGTRDMCPKKEGMDILVTTGTWVNELECICTTNSIFVCPVSPQIFGMIFSMILCCAIKRSRDFV